jgi:PAS domain S-box-containing protein
VRTPQAGEWASERLIGGAIEAAPIAFVVLSVDGRYVAANRAASRFSGYSRSELMSLRSGDLSADPKRTQATIEAVLRTGGGAGERDILRKDGSVLRVQFRLGPAQLGEERVLVAAWWPTNKLDPADADELVEEDSKPLARTQERLTGLVFQKAPIAITITDRAGLYLAVNDKATEITGYSREELLALDAWAIAVPSRRPPGEDLTALGARDGQASICCKDGTVKQVEFRVATTTLGHEQVRISLWWEIA